MNTSTAGVGLDLLKQFFTQGSGQADLNSLLEQNNAAKGEQSRRLFHHFGTQGKPQRHEGINGGAIDPLTGRESVSGLDRFYNNNPHLRRGESSQLGRQRQVEGIRREDELSKLMHQQKVLKLRGGNNELDKFARSNQILTQEQEENLAFDPEFYGPNKQFLPRR